MQLAAQKRRSTVSFPRTLLRFTAFACTLFAVSCLTPDFSGLEPDGASSGGKGSGGEVSTGGMSMGGDSTADHCTNSSLDPGETDVNCGGECPPCAVDHNCLYNSDCETENCITGRCKEPTCTDDAVNQDETDSDCGGLICDGCATGQNCLKDTDCESQSCRSGMCEAASCSDQKRNNGETDIDCGGTLCEDRCDVGSTCKIGSDCEQPNVNDPPTASCTSEGSTKVCRLDCPPKTGDCNEKASDGCETRTETSLAHCGGCGQLCDPPHVALSLCNSGMCEIDATQPNGGCDPGYADCDGKADNGCETNLRTDLLHCGTCETECSGNNGDASCKSGVCEIECEFGFDDCDDDATSNGCEADIRSSVNNCGGCGVDDDAHICVPLLPGDAAYCALGVCGSVNCTSDGYPGFGACSGDGVCDDELNTIDDCGACGEGCAVTSGTASCDPAAGSTFECAVDTCETGYGDCDDDYATGCEVNTETDKFHCGDCTSSDPRPGSGQSCQALADTASLRVASATCGDGECEIVCDAGYADCDGNPANGCEINLTSNTARCGGCLPSDANPGNGENCGTKWPHGGTSTCTSGGVCQLGCSSGYASCNSSSSDGCEVSSSNSVANCGACNVYCGGDASQTNVNSASCGAGSCSVSCDSGFCPDLSNPERPCTTSTGTIMNCGSCGDTCTGTNPFCDMSSTPVCRQRFPTTIVQQLAVTGAMSGQVRTFDLPSVSGPGLGRMVLVLVASSSALTTVTLGGSNMILAGKTDTFGDGQPGVTAAYYLLDASLGGAGTKSITVTNSYFYDFVAAYELRYARQDAAPGWVQTWTGTDCSTTAMNVQVSAPVSYSGSALFASMFAQGSAAATGTPIGSLTELAEVFNSNQGTGLLGHRTGVNSTTTVGWAIAGTCWSTGLGVAVIDPFITNE